MNEDAEARERGLASFRSWSSLCAMCYRERRLAQYEDDILFVAMIKAKVLVHDSLLYDRKIASSGYGQIGRGIRRRSTKRLANAEYTNGETNYTVCAHLRPQLNLAWFSSAMC